MIPPDAILIVLFALLTVATYVLWVAGRLPGTRKLFALLAIATLVLAVVFHDLEIAKSASDESNPAPTSTDTAHPAGSIAGGGAGAGA